MPGRGQGRGRGQGSSGLFGRPGHGQGFWRSRLGRGLLWLGVLALIVFGALWAANYILRAAFSMG
jgi:hypothetical protein